MSAASRKQHRRGRVSLSGLRDDLVARIKELDASRAKHDWPTLDASLVALGRNVIAALELLRQNDTVAKDHLAELRATLHAKAIDPTVVGGGAMGAGIGEMLRGLDTKCRTVVDSYHGLPGVK